MHAGWTIEVSFNDSGLPLGNLTSKFDSLLGFLLDLCVYEFCSISLLGPPRCVLVSVLQAHLHV
jgi:hypothetical protein